MVEQEFGRKIKPDSIPNDVFDDWETKYNDLLSELTEWYQEEQTKKINI